jgi:hypothetical protein
MLFSLVFVFKAAKRISRSHAFGVMEMWVTFLGYPSGVGRCGKPAGFSTLSIARHFHNALE